MKWPWSKRQGVAWPELPSRGFIVGRAATVADIDSGEAVFCQQSDDHILAQPYSILLPQYALWRDETGALVPTILVQAEKHIHHADDQPLFGLRRFDGSAIVAMGEEVELLGLKTPA